MGERAQGGRRGAVAAALVVASLSASMGSAETLAGRVVRVQDGDSLVVQAEERTVAIRLAEIDAPERDQPWASRAKRALSEKVFGRAVVAEVLDIDDYGRSVARIRRGGRDINREMVREGHAWVYRRYLRDESLLADEAEARAERAGLWALSEAERMPPWQWRHGGAIAGSEPREPAAREDEADFRCTGKCSCREMRSCAEARFHLRHCGVRRLDGDGDGTPCEALCR